MFGGELGLVGGSKGGAVLSTGAAAINGCDGPKFSTSVTSRTLKAGVQVAQQGQGANHSRVDPQDALWASELCQMLSSLLLSNSTQSEPKKSSLLEP